MQEQNAWLYDRYFSSMEKITETTLEILADRVFPYLTRDYSYWNVPSYKVNIIIETKNLIFLMSKLFIGKAFTTLSAGDCS